jgi:hypothetical protein
MLLLARIRYKYFYYMICSQPSPGCPTRPLRRAALACWLALSLQLGACGGGAVAAGPTPLPPVTPLPAVDISPVVAADPGSLLAPDGDRGAFMQIFVRSDQDSGGDGIGDLPRLGANARLSPVLPASASPATAGADGRWTVTLPAQSTRVMDLPL